MRIKNQRRSFTSNRMFPCRRRRRSIISKRYISEDWTPRKIVDLYMSTETNSDFVRVLGDYCFPEIEPEEFWDLWYGISWLQNEEDIIENGTIDYLDEIYDLFEEAFCIYHGVDSLSELEHLRPKRYR